MESYRDSSIFEGWFEFCTDAGEEMRVEDRGAQWGIYEKSGDAFIFGGMVRKRSNESTANANLRSIHTRFERYA